MKLYVTPSGWKLTNSETGEIIDEKQSEMSVEYILILLKNLQEQYGVHIELFTGNDDMLSSQEYLSAKKVIRQYELNNIGKCSQSVNRQESNLDAFNRIKQEGIGYAVQHYSDGTEYADPMTRLLWKLAGDSLNELESYLKNSIINIEEI